MIRGPPKGQQRTDNRPRAREASAVRRRRCRGRPSSRLRTWELPACEGRACVRSASQQQARFGAARGSPRPRADQLSADRLARRSSQTSVSARRTSDVASRSIIRTRTRLHSACLPLTRRRFIRRRVRQADRTDRRTLAGSSWRPWSFRAVPSPASSEVARSRCRRSSPGHPSGCDAHLARAFPAERFICAARTSGGHTRAPRELKPCSSCSRCDGRSSRSASDGVRIQRSVGLAPTASPSRPADGPELAARTTVTFRWRDHPSFFRQRRLSRQRPRSREGLQLHQHPRARATGRRAAPA